MAIVIQCKCGKKLKTKDENAGRKTFCPTCGTPIVFQASQESSSVKIPEKKDSILGGGFSSEPEEEKTSFPKPAIYVGIFVVLGIIGSIAKESGWVAGDTGSASPELVAVAGAGSASSPKNVHPASFERVKGEPDENRIQQIDASVVVALNSGSMSESIKMAAYYAEFSKSPNDRAYGRNRVVEILQDNGLKNVESADVDYVIDRFANEESVERLFDVVCAKLEILLKEMKEKKLRKRLVQAFDAEDRDDNEIIQVMKDLVEKYPNDPRVLALLHEMAAARKAHDAEVAQLDK